MPEFSNRQVTVSALGLALHDHEAVYASMVGPKGSLKSIWAGLVMNSRPVTYAPGWDWTNFKAGGGAKQFWAALPRASSHHLVVRGMAKALIFITDPAAAALHDSSARMQRRAKLAARMPEAHLALAAYLEAYEFDFGGEPARLPMLAQWAPVIWDYAVSQHAGTAGYGIWGLDAYGDCLGAFKINPSYPWADTIQELIKAGKLVW
jgi:hypothetical protein